MRYNNTISGNAMVYVLIALALVGFLTLTLSKQNDQAGDQDLDDEQVALYAQNLMGYASSAQSAVDMMIATGSDFTNLDPVLPTDANFNTGSAAHKIYHPLGGGLTYQEGFISAIENGSNAGWKINKSINVEWTTTPADDVVLTAYFIDKQVCQTINQFITGSKTIPATVNPHDDYFLGTSTTDFDAVQCAACDGYPSLCVENDTGDGYSFYNVIVAQ